MSETDAETIRKTANRLKRARGQLTAVIEAVEAGGDCRAVVTQLAAVSKALDRAGFAIVSTAMRTCLIEDDGTATEDDRLSLEDLEKLFLTLA
ncbi:metal-sensitive transcriptional regulator [Microbacterium mcarthurae (nom. nud.)]|uniref:Metal-sensitive transcriptional regulator n=1 Tax=Microbacterium mcarthurae TaxID=3035918 RepID=A0ABW9GGL7_9MICO